MTTNYQETLRRYIPIDVSVRTEATAKSWYKIIELEAHSTKSEEYKTEQLLELMRIHHEPTARHMQRVGNIAFAITDIIGDPSLIAELSGTNHDIGKLLIDPVLIERKPPTQCTDLEKNTLSHHPEFSFAILSALGFPVQIASTARYHHSNYVYVQDKTELYTPKGNFLPSIVRLADSIVSATTDHKDRPYQPPTTLREIIVNLNSKFMLGDIQSSLQERMADILLDSRLGLDNIPL